MPHDRKTDRNQGNQQRQPHKGDKGVPNIESEDVRQVGSDEELELDEQGEIVTQRIPRQSDEGIREREEERDRMDREEGGDEDT